MRKRYEWTRHVLKTEEKKLRFQKNTDKCEQGLRQSWILDSSPRISDSRYWIPDFTSGTFIPDSDG